MSVCGNISWPPVYFCHPQAFVLRYVFADIKLLFVLVVVKVVLIMLLVLCELLSYLSVDGAKKQSCGHYELLIVPVPRGTLTAAALMVVAFAFAHRPALC